MQRRKTRLPSLTVGLIAALSLVSLGPIPEARATTITVTTTVDELNDDGDCSLREAIQAANTDSEVDACPAGNGTDTISLPSGTYNLTLPGAGEDDNASGDLDVTDDLIIIGSGPSRPRIDATHIDRVLHAHVGASLEIEYARIVNGRPPDGTGDGDGADGGGIHVSSSLTLKDCYLGYNKTGDGAGSGRGGNGGAIFGTANLTIDDTTIEGNDTGSGGDNPAGRGGRGGHGGGIHGYGTLRISNSTVWFNTCGDGGEGQDGGSGGQGGGLYTYVGRLYLNDSQVSGNYAGDGGDASIASGKGGQGGDGGGIYTYSADVHVTRSRLAVNHAGRGGSGTSGSEENGDGGSGGGIHVYNRGELTLVDSLLNGNKTGLAGSTGSGGVPGNGGGIHAEGEIALVNSTISDNEAGQGGGLSFDLTTAVAAISYCTIAKNSVTGFGGGLVQPSGPTVVFASTIIADNSSSGMGPDCFSAGSLASSGYNLVENVSNCPFAADPSDITGSDPNLAGLADNGGPTFTHALQAGSLAIDQIQDGYGGCEVGVSTDQRGLVRGGGAGIGGSACDIGAYEYESGPTVRFDHAQISAEEDDESVPITVRLVSAWDTEITVDYATSNGTATAGEDYTAAAGTLTFEPGEDAKSFAVPILEDEDNEGRETVFLDLSDPTNAALGAPSQATLTINDPKDQPKVRFTASEYTVHEGIGAATISVELDEDTPRLVEVGYETYSGSDPSAVAGSDYMTASGTLDFFPGELVQTFSVTILDDDLEEGSESARMRLIDPLNARLASPRTCRLTILDDESVGWVFLPLVQRED